MENIRKTLDTLEKPEGKTKYGGQCEEINSVKIRYFFMARIKITILFLDRIFIRRTISSIKAETHYATNRCDKSPRQVAATCRLVRHLKIIVTTICRTNSNWFEFVRHIAATK